MGNNVTKPLQIDYFSDVLCVWGYVSQIRLDELKSNFGEQINIHQHFITLFGNTEKRITEKWQSKGGFTGFNKHTLEVGEQFEHLSINPKVWIDCKPKSSATAHLFLKAIQMIEDNNKQNNTSLLDQISWSVRKAFFEDAKDTGNLDVLLEIAESFSISPDSILELMHNGGAMAELCSDMETREHYKLEGSPTYLLNHGRQKLYGNVGYRVIEANVQELLTTKGGASWC